LAINDRLMQAAQWFAEDMATKDYFPDDHVDSLGRDPGQRATAFGYSWSWIGENIAAGFTRACDVVNAWLGSPGHHANIDAAYVHIGVGHAYNPASYYRHYWVADFGRPR